jgi:hypothetical protein
MGNLIVSDKEFRDMAQAVKEFYLGAAADLDEYRAKMKETLDTATMEGNLATNLAMFLDVAKSAAYGLEDIGPQTETLVSEFISAINEADDFLYF